jgi:hypothetical protein
VPCSLAACRHVACSCCCRPTAGQLPRWGPPAGQGWAFGEQKRWCCVTIDGGGVFCDVAAVQVVILPA